MSPWVCAASRGGVGDWLACTLCLLATCKLLPSPAALPGGQPRAHDDAPGPQGSLSGTTLHVYVQTCARREQGRAGQGRAGHQGTTSCRFCPNIRIGASARPPVGLPDCLPAAVPVGPSAVNLPHCGARRLMPQQLLAGHWWQLTPSGLRGSQVCGPWGWRAGVRRCGVVSTHAVLGHRVCGKVTPPPCLHGHVLWSGLNVRAPASVKGSTDTERFKPNLVPSAPFIGRQPGRALATCSHEAKPDHKASSRAPVQALDQCGCSQLTVVALYGRNVCWQQARLERNAQAAPRRCKQHPPNV
jgi:hypothetical protein